MIKPKWKSLLQRSVVEWLTAHPDVSRNEIARRADLDKSIVIKIANGEKDNLNGDSAVKLAGVMGITVEDLYAGRSTPSTAPASVPAEVIDATTDVRGTLRMLSLDQLAINPLNPRKAFDDDTIGELAESIATHGVLQNLVSAPPGKDGLHVVTAGGRRQRALMRLAEVGRWDPKAPNIPVRVLNSDEPHVRALALVENLQRVELRPMEEAEAFAELHELDPTTWTTTRIAETVHRTQRFVQQRLALATKLTAPAKRALTEGVISVEMARELAKAPMKQQAQIVATIKTDAQNEWGEKWDAEAIREEITGSWYPVSRALFDRQAYDGEIVRDDNDGEAWFTDAKQFEKLQLAAAEAKATELRTQRAWVKVVNAHKHQYFHSYDYNTSRAKDLSRAGAVIEIEHDWEIKVHDGLLERTSDSGTASRSANTKSSSKASAATEKPEPEPYTKSLLIRTKGEKTAHLQDAIVRVGCRDEGDTAICLAIVGMLGIVSKVKIGDASYGSEDTRRGAAQARRMQALYAEIVAAAKAQKARGGSVSEPDDDDDVADDVEADDAGVLDRDPDQVNRPWSEWSGPPPMAIWTWLRGKTRDERLQIFATLIADRCGYYVGYAASVAPHHDAFDVALAQHLGIDMRSVWRPTEAWLAGSRKPRLEVLARGLRIDPLPKSTTQLRAAIAARFEEADKPGGEQLPPAAEWVPPEMRILDKAAFDKAFTHYKQLPDPEPAGERRSRRAQAEGASA
ncbi:ParB/RepB/Spo0J family partition protein [Vineibacter terrae]|uniref:ParB/RepB/Spo0J family partition protein n=1 Tax=Vineibacter terrae TaxID=2586908 RepID=A0A5C8PFT8_9HYPH|nr:ParB/RepB/Spo0J family partition protein [Vineibacter terrae]TXL72525.1 ParB/RepB/Spo0J family partition protein [Vineibacter terrae]